MVNLKRILFSCLLLLLPLTACARSGKAIDGKVVEQGSHKPIPNAIVIARWHGTVSALVDAQTVCMHVEFATTDAQGNYRLPSWRKPSTMGPVFDVQPTVTAHKPGYRLAEEYPETTPMLVSFTGSRWEKLEYLKRVSNAAGCSDKKEIERNLLPLYRALYEEAKGIAVTKEDREKVETLLFGLESIEFGSMEALNRMTERRKIQK